MVAHPFISQHIFLYLLYHILAIFEIAKLAFEQQKRQHKAVFEKAMGIRLIRPVCMVYRRGMADTRPQRGF